MIHGIAGSATITEGDVEQVVEAEGEGDGLLSDHTSGDTSALMAI